MAPSKKHQELEVLVKQRQNSKENILRISELIDNLQVVPSAEELECRLEIVEAYFTQALEYQSSIEELNISSVNVIAVAVRGDLEEIYCAAKVKIRTLMKQQTTKSSAYTCGNKFSDNLPKLKLPTFAGKYADFQNFIRLFKTLVHDDSRLSTIEKFNHLTSCLSGSALRTIKALDNTEENYETALTLLEKRFDNKYLMCQDHIRDLLRQNKVQRGSAEQLRCLIDNVTAHFNALCALLNYEEIANAFIVHVVVSSLDIESQSKIEESIDCKKILSWADCSNLLSQRCQILESREIKQNAFEPRQVRQLPNKHFDRSAKPIALTTANIYCSICEQNTNHPIWKCNKFLELSPVQRFEHCKKLLLCINCLSSTHSLQQCKSSTCKHCKSLHHTLLHRGNTSVSNSSSISKTTVSHSQNSIQPQLHQHQLRPQATEWSSTSKASDNMNATSTAMTTQQTLSSKNINSIHNQTILATAVIEMIDNSGNKQLVRALLDSASQLNFVTQSCAQALNLNKVKAFTNVGGIGQVQTQAKFSITTTIHSRVTNYKTSLQFMILPSITGVHPDAKFDSNSLNIPDDLPLADPLFNVPQKIDVLIGADIFYDLFDGHQIKLGVNLPILTHSVFGWLVSGRYKTHQTSSALLANNATVADDNNLNELVKAFWETEKVPDSKRKLSREQEECEEHFLENVVQLDSGRFQVRLPFKQDPNTIGDSKQMALRRFLSLEKRLSANSELKQAYDDFLNQYEADGHMTQIDWPSSFEGYYVMPHHSVLRPDKSTTKCRVVFDASAKAANNISLNDILKVGPVVQNELVDILLRFRMHRYGVMADITAMYRQIWIHPHDRVVQNIIWRKTTSEKLKLYRLNTITYGTASAPYLATRTLVHIANEHQQQNVKASAIIKHDFYVDDLISGGSSLAEIQTIKKEVGDILEKGGFKLRKWFSNHNAFVSEVNEEDREKPIKINDALMVKTLGIIWDANSDTFRFNYKSDRTITKSITKRSVLAEMSRIFDPIGLIKPIIVRVKIFLQELWLQKLDWDEEVPSENVASWNEFLNQLADLNTIKIPRYVLLLNCKTQLHGFADASNRAYGCCFYVRSEDSLGNIKVSLLTSRSRVAPISTVRTIPCLELCGAHLLTILFKEIRNVTSFDSIYFWSDSIIVLHWLAEHASNFNTFVANRVSFIQEHSSGIPWRYVPSTSNPADIISRGSTVAELNSSIWFTGPQFLYKSIEYWPVHLKQKISDLPERKGNKTVLVVNTNDLITFINSRSRFSETCRILAYIRRFINNCRNRHNRKKSLSKTITSNEFDAAFTNIIFLIQQFYYTTEFDSLQKNKQVNNNSTIKALNPFIEQESNWLIIKVGGRLKKSQLPYMTQCPIILPKQSNFVESYVQHLHTTNFHAGAQSLLNIIQQRFWIVGAREYARKIVKRCVLCFKYRPRLMSQIMGDLPEHRITPVKPFTHCGVDFCGPIITTTRIRGNRKYKSYIAVFICFVTHAVHLEVVSALTADAFIAALKRFTGRRGLCTTLYCDNATNFVGAKNYLKELKDAFMNEQFQNNLMTWCTGQQIEFKHIPPRSPHFGGLWEAAVKSAKTLLFKFMQSALFTFEELTTAVIQIEAILNSRPMTPMTNDPNDERALTPAHFLNQSRAECIVEPRSSFEKISSLKTWKQITAIQQHFWKRWSKEYLILLQQRRKWIKNLNNLKVGTLVMIHEENLPTQKWAIGRIIKTIPGADGKVRVADIKTQQGIFRRAITKLAALPIETSD